MFFLIIQQAPVVWWVPVLSGWKRKMLGRCVFKVAINTCSLIARMAGWMLE